MADPRLQALDVRQPPHLELGIFEGLAERGSSQTPFIRSGVLVGVAWCSRIRQGHTLCSARPSPYA